MRNQGKDAYRPEAYGKSIIIERKISKESVSYKIKSASGKTFTAKNITALEREHFSE